jgi:hypothetical protein
LAWLAAAPLPATSLPITSQAQLTRYLHDAPVGTTPLDALSAGGRKRFLAQLDFGPRGVRSLSTTDADHELTHAQIVRLLALFGAERHAGDGLTAVEQARRQRERAKDAAARGCAVQTCPPSDIERRYDTLVLAADEPGATAAKRGIRSRQRYHRLFAAMQKPERLTRMSATDLRLLRRAAEEIGVSSSIPVDDLTQDLAEMQRRGMLTDRDYASLHQALVAQRDFAAADTLFRAHPHMGVPALPRLQRSASLPAAQPTALTLDPGAASMRREAFDLSAPLRIVVVASCHFSRDAARAIAADATLRPIFVDHAIWLASQNETFDAVADWNRQFPAQPIHVAWRDGEWPMLRNWSMPTFYVFRHGRLVSRFSGWQDTDALKQSLRNAGVLR